MLVRAIAHYCVECHQCFIKIFSTGSNLSCLYILYRVASHQTHKSHVQNLLHQTSNSPRAAWTCVCRIRIFKVSFDVVYLLIMLVGHDYAGSPQKNGSPIECITHWVVISPCVCECILQPSYRLNCDSQALANIAGPQHVLKTLPRCKTDGNQNQELFLFFLFLSKSLHSNSSILTVDNTVYMYLKQANCTHLLYIYGT